ncbi:Flp family type IVb pilin [Paracandidimonas lactea]|uniref:Flp family type IVb pilin n=1 Tax=Paracandidimonas lactea TaxID=2895524 RepID=UPI001F32878F|nr:Flp family type IVb pilin [Paracandidimonas lactea]
MRNFLKKLRRDERGVSALEYAILAGLIVGAVVIGVGLFTDGLQTGFQNLSTAVTTATTPPPTTP